MAKTKLSVIVPCYNEEKRLKVGFLHYYSYLKNANFSWELIFVNDGSKDKTLSLLRKLSRNKKNIKLISYKDNKGKGSAITKGIQEAQGDIVLFTDIDHSVEIKTIETFFDYFNKGYQSVIGSRRVPGAKLVKRQTYFREFLGRGFTLLVRIFIDFKIKDATCGFKAFENKTAKKIFKKLKVSGWAFDAEILFLCKKYKVKYTQAPVAWKDVKGTKVSLKRDILGSLIGLLQIRANELLGSYT